MQNRSENKQNISNNKKRESFVFYRSFFEAIKMLEKEQKAEVLEAICCYALDQEEINLSGVSKGFFTLIKPQLDANIKRFENGSKPKQKISKPEAKPKQNRSKTKANDNVNDNVNVIISSKNKSLEEIATPVFVKKETWQSFVRMRQKIKKPLTEEAANLILKKLETFENKRAGWANLALENSIEGSWQGIFEPREEQRKTEKKSSYNDFHKNDYSAPEGFET